MPSRKLLFFNKRLLKVEGICMENFVKITSLYCEKFNQRILFKIGRLFTNLFFFFLIFLTVVKLKKWNIQGEAHESWMYLQKFCG